MTDAIAVENRLRHLSHSGDNNVTQRRTARRLSVIDGCAWYGCEDNHVDSIFLNGTVGVGKTTLANDISNVESNTYAVVDLDDVRRFGPVPRSDRFNHELELQNLSSLVKNNRRAGAERFVLTGVVETLLRSLGIWMLSDQQKCLSAG